MGRVLIIEIASGTRRLELEPGEYTVGREAECGIVIDDAGVSRQHARLVVDSRSGAIEDLGSSNGTLVNGESVSSRTELGPGDVVTIGAARLLLQPSEQDGGETDPARTPEPALSLQSFLEGEATLDEGLRTIKASVAGGGSKGLNWRVKLVALISGTIFLASLLIGGMLWYQRRGIWLTRAVLEMRSLASENIDALTTADAELLSADSVQGDRRVSNPVVLDPEGNVLWAAPGAREQIGKKWTGWPSERPSSRRDVLVRPPGPGAPAHRPRLLLPVQSGGRHLGWIAAGWDRQEAGESGGPASIMIAIGLFLVLLSYLVLEGSATWVTRPVRRLAAEIRGLRRDETLSFQVPAGVPELGELNEAVSVALQASGPAGGVVQASRSDTRSDWAGAIPIPLVLLDEDYNVTDSNPEARRLLGLPDTQRETIHFGRFLQGSYFGTSVLQLVKSTGPGETNSAVLELAVDGRKVPVNVLVRRPSPGSGHAVALVLVRQQGTLER